MTTAAKTEMGSLGRIDPVNLTKNPNNPRRYFNEERLDLLRTSIQEVGILVPLIAYENPDVTGEFVLLDGERRWRSALDLGLEAVPANIIERPSPLDNLLRMFNIHNVREDWPLISIALSLQEVVRLSEEKRESRLAEMTGLTRSTVRRAKRLLRLPESELRLIQEEAHLDRTQQVHREDLYLEIETATSVLRHDLPELADEFTPEEMIRQFARKREVGSLRAVTDFRAVGKMVKAIDDQLVPREVVVDAARNLIKNPELTPDRVFDEIAAGAYAQQALQRKAELLRLSVVELDTSQPLSPDLLDTLQQLRRALTELIESLGQ